MIIPSMLAPPSTTLQRGSARLRGPLRVSGMTASVAPPYQGDSGSPSALSARPSLPALSDTPPMLEPHDHRRGGLLGVRLQRWVWTRRASSWDHGGAGGLERVIDAVLDAAEVRPGSVAIDLGCGTGQLSLPLARNGAYVMAVDVSRAMVDLLEAKATASGVRGILGVVTPIETLSLPEQSADLVISNYALHHLRDRDKAAFVEEAASWLRPGGRLVVGDMMFGRGATARDRSIIASKVAVLARRGPARLVAIGEERHPIHAAPPRATGVDGHLDAPLRDGWPDRRLGDARCLGGRRDRGDQTLASPYRGIREEWDPCPSGRRHRAPSAPPSRFRKDRRASIGRRALGIEAVAVREDWRPNVRR